MTTPLHSLTKVQQKDGILQKSRRHMSTHVATANELSQIISLHQSGYLDEAEDQYRQFLLKNPTHSDALQLLGTVYAQKGFNDQSLDYFKQSLEINPNQATVHNNLGNVYIDKKMFHLGLSCFDKAIKLKSNFPHAWHNKGNAYFELGEFEKAVESFKVAILLNPKDSQNHNHLGNAQQALSFYDEALKSYKLALDLNPLNAEAYNNQGALYQALFQYENALASFEQATYLQENNPQAHYNRGRVLKELDRVQESIDAFCRAIEMKPDFFEAYNNLANVLKDEKDLEQAFTLYSKVIELNPNFSQAYYNRGTILQEYNEIEQATLNYEMALSIAPDYADAHLNLGLVSLMGFDFAKGWNHYEWRFKSQQFQVSSFDSHRPEWSHLTDTSSKKRLLIWSEQGVGDVLMFCSLLSEFISKLDNTLVLVQLDERLLPLMRRSITGVEFCSTTHTLTDIDFDEQIPIGKLAAYTRSNVDAFAKQKKAFLGADKTKTQTLLGQLNSGFRPHQASELIHSGERLIGISWRSTAAKTGEQRSLSLKDLAQSLDASGVRLISLQYGDVGKEISDCSLQTGIQIEQVSSVDNFRDLDGLASLIDLCDEVVSVDNATVHLSGSLGKKTQVLLPFHPDWRWGLATEQCIWYPSVQLLRQSVPEVWSSVLQALKNG